ncbi:MAG: molecular chaperone TorD family protein, partial [Pseudomonadota bacterium]
MTNPESSGLPPSVVEEDRLRADLYDILAALLARPPARDLIDRVSRLDGDETPLGSAIGALSRVAKASTEKAVECEFNALFIGLARGELLPYASY